ncbi:hypothetical protein WUBG_15231 [Wuchereria bancrofti]|uniref:Uncharacterized protein n=1 Tax=Wuchereria bancrofti TaxID=6293 RepID=J9DW03_WUCBA|nr:hypothetical protein WUBG_15231 [Wuchereria bancrofti]
MSHKLFLSEGSIDMASRTPIIVAEAEKWREFKPIMQQENHEAEPTVSELFHTPEVEGLPKIIPTVPCQLRNIDPYEYQVVDPNIELEDDEDEEKLSIRPRFGGRKTMPKELRTD